MTEENEEKARQVAEGHHNCGWTTKTTWEARSELQVKQQDIWIA
jgi:hypothetical protein